MIACSRMQDPRVATLHFAERHCNRPKHRQRRRRRRRQSHMQRRTLRRGAAAKSARKQERMTVRRKSRERRECRGRIRVGPRNRNAQLQVKWPAMRRHATKCGTRAQAKNGQRVAQTTGDSACSDCTQPAVPLLRTRDTPHTEWAERQAVRAEGGAVTQRHSQLHRARGTDSTQRAELLTQSSTSARNLWAGTMRMQ